MKAVIYARYSSHNQTEQSIEGQLRFCHKYAESCGYRIIGEYIDRAISGTSDNRPDFQRMIADAEKKQFNYIIVWKLDRFSRNRYDSAIYKNKLKKYGVRVISATETVGDGDESIIMEAMLEAMAEVYSRQLGQNVKRGMRESALKGNHTGGYTPIGYKVVDNKLLIDDVTAQTVRFIFNEYASGKGKKEICSECKERGYKSRANKDITINSITQIVNNRVYFGDATYKHGTAEEIKRECPAIISKEIWDKCQLRESTGKRLRGQRPCDDVHYLLTGKLFCGHCGERMTGDKGTSKTGKTHHYYTCYNRKRRKGCNKKSERKDDVETYVINKTLNYVLCEKNMKYIAEGVVKAYNANFNDSEIDSLKKALKQIDAEIDKCVTALLNTSSQTMIERINKRSNELEQQKKDIEIDIAKMTVAARVKLTEHDVLDWLRQFCDGDPEDEDFRQHIIDTFVNSIYLYDDKIIIYFNIKSRTPISFEEHNKNLENLNDSRSSDSLLNRQPNKTDNCIKIICLIFCRFVKVYKL